MDRALCRLGLGLVDLGHDLLALILSDAERRNLEEDAVGLGFTSHKHVSISTLVVVDHDGLGTGHLGPVGLHAKAAGAARDKGDLAGVRLAGKRFAAFLWGGQDHILIVELKTGVNLGSKIGLQQNQRSWRYVAGEGWVEQELRNCSRPVDRIKYRRKGGTYVSSGVLAFAPVENHIVAVAVRAVDGDRDLLLLHRGVLMFSLST
eukprot:COSAG05_NODE_2828_length_2594_cov_1.947495_4_plen_205_part_00